MRKDSVKMGPPVKKRKLNGDLKASPSATRSLDFFFGKQNNQLDTSKAETSQHDAKGSVVLSDEELARKLQAEWDQEDGNGGETNASTGGGDIKQDTFSMNADTRDGPLNEKETPNGMGVDNTSFAARRKPSSPLLPQSPKKNTLSLQSAASAEDTITANVPFDESPLVFEPSQYVADLQKVWAADGGNATYALLTRCFVLVNSTQSRIKIVDTLVNLLRLIIESDPSSLLPTVSVWQFGPLDALMCISCYILLYYNCIRFDNRV